MLAEPRDVRRAHLDGAGNHELEHADALREPHDGLGLPAQDRRVHARRVAVGGDVAEVRQVRRLGVNDGVEVDAAARHLVLVHGEVRVELGRQPREAAGV